MDRLAFLFFPPYFIVDWSKYKTYLSNSDLSFPAINNATYIGSAVINFKNSITNAQKHITYRYVKHNNSLFLSHYIHNIC